MSSRKSRGIFDETELYNFCLAEVCGMGMEEGNRFNFLDFISEEQGRKFDSLSEAGQRAFEKKLTKTAKLLKEEFEDLSSDNVETDEDYEELCENKNVLANTVANHMEEFLAYE